MAAEDNVALTKIVKVSLQGGHLYIHANFAIEIIQKRRYCSIGQTF